MKAFLMHRDRDFDLRRELPSNKQELTQDLALDTLFNAMAQGDQFLFEVAREAVLNGLENDLETIQYRQDILKDCLNHPALIREMYKIAVDSIEGKKKTYFGYFTNYPETILHSSLAVLRLFMVMLKNLRAIAVEHAGGFHSEGFITFFNMLRSELPDEYFAAVQSHLERLKFNDGVYINARLGKGNQGRDYILRRPPDGVRNWIKRLLDQRSNGHTLYIAERDQSGAGALRELRNRGINQVANAAAQSADHILSFFEMLKTELAFYIGCLNLHAQLAQKGEPLCFPVLAAPGEREYAFTGLYDACLALNLEEKMIGNDLDIRNKDLVIITGANQGGKSTFLRSIGVSQLMMQCGMFAPALTYSANIFDRLFPHYKREEDVAMNSGKLDEELSRMSEIADNLTPNSLVLFNESFAATNEREASEIARQIVTALVEKHIQVFFVTHLYELAHGFYKRNMDNAIFLRAERHEGGKRTFKIREGEPLQTSYGEDLYHKIFETGI